MKKRILIAGGTGLIGSALQKEASEKGWKVVVLSRRSSPGHIRWDPPASMISLTNPTHFDAIINLAGASIAGRWTAKRIKEIHDSRIQACSTIEKYLANGMITTDVYIGTSAIGIYGDHGDQLVDEKSPLGDDADWMVTTGKAWEEGHRRMSTSGVRTIVFRTGIVLSLKGGALKEIIRTAPFGIIGYFGNGRQFWPWIHMQDLVAMIFSAIEDERMAGLYLAVAPGGATNKELSKTVSKAFHVRRLVMPVPVPVLSILLGRLRRMLLQSCKGYPARLIAEGFSFRFPSIREAVNDLFRKGKMEG